MTDSANINIEVYTGQAIQPYLNDVAELRIAVFKEWPYCYEGTLVYEATYLNRYALCNKSLFILATSEESCQRKIIGASTAIPLKQDEAIFQKAFIAQGIAPESVLYFGESIILPDYRGQGLGGCFFDEREAYARQLNRPLVSFCAVVRDENDPRKPVNYRSPESLWRKRGYEAVEGLQTQLAWTEVGQTQDSSKCMQFWTKTLRP